MRMRLDRQDREEVCVVTAQPGYSIWAIVDGDAVEAGTVVAWVIDRNGAITPISDVDGLDRSSQQSFIKDPLGRCYIPYISGYMSFDDVVAECNKL